MEDAEHYLAIDPARLKRARLHKALSQRDLAKAAGVSLNTINRLETGRRTARIGTIKRLATALDIAPTDIAEVATTSGAQMWKTA